MALRQLVRFVKSLRIYLYCYYDAYILDRGYTNSFGGEHNAIYFKTAFFVTIEKDCQNIYV